MSVTATWINPPALTAYQITMANAHEIVQELVSLFAQGIHSSAVPVVVGSTPDWQISIQQPNYIDQIANLNDWIVVGGVGPFGPQVVVWPEATFAANFTTS